MFENSRQTQRICKGMHSIPYVTFVNPLCSPYILEKCRVFNDSFKIPAKLLLITAVLPPDWIINALDDFIGYAVIAVIIEFNITIANPNIIKNSLWIIEKPTYIGMIDAIYVAKVAC